jgi:hypothetical protein
METEENGRERNEEGKFQKGNKASTGRGPNKVSTRVKESIVSFLENNVDKIQESFDQLGPANKLKFIAEILPYATPKLSAVQSEVETNGEIQVTVKYERRGNTTATPSQSGEGQE